MHIHINNITDKMKTTKTKNKQGNSDRLKGDTEILAVRRIDGLTADLKRLTRHYGISNESQVVRMIIKEKVNSI